MDPHPRVIVRRSAHKLVAALAPLCIWMLRFAVFLLLTVHALVSAGADGPQPPCVLAPVPAYPPPGKAPTIEVWHDEDLQRSGWRPPGCLGWAPTSRSKLIVALAGSFRFDGTADELIGRIGAISRLRDIQYWSVTDKSWRPLVTEASALSGPNARSRRADFLPDEMATGSALYYWENDSRSGKIVQRMTVRERRPDSVSVAIDNVTPVRFLMVTLFEAGALQSVQFLKRISPGVWGIYLVTRTGEGASALAGGHEASYINRAVAVYRYLAGIPTRDGPPAVP